MNIGFIGLGIMGKPMAQNLLKHGYKITVFDINDTPMEQLEQEGAKTAASPKEAATANDIIITMLPKSEHVEAVIFNENGVLAGAKKGAIVVDMSSITPVVSRDIAARLKQRDVDMMDAPVSGGEPKAVDATLAIMAGGKEPVFDKIKPILSLMGEAITLVGDHGAGTTAKLANQIIVNVNIAAMSEALALAAKADLDVKKMYEAIRGGLAGSAVLDAKVPMILDRNFKAGGRIDINHKDLTNVKETADEIGVPLPLSNQVLNMFDALLETGHAADDHGGLVQYYENLASTEVKRRNDIGTT